MQLDFRATLAASSSSKATLISQRSGLWGRRQWILDFRFWIGLVSRSLSKSDNCTQRYF
ncbi:MULTISPECIES: hypothetical protein [unclassified Microcoleus]|uniref:hypothetical protein n=1 Tax=unclassified Microcoleus TaxID=2642155 RepID=UPI0025DA5310|nr:MULTISPECIES: hypothetical protein [unclassified Microcoleus]